MQKLKEIEKSLKINLSKNAELFKNLKDDSLFKINRLK